MIFFNFLCCVVKVGYKKIGVIQDSPNISLLLENTCPVFLSLSKKTSEENLYTRKLAEVLLLTLVT